MRAELALVSRVSEATPETMLATSEKLIHDLPSTLAALKAGEIAYRHAQMLVDQVYGLEPADTAALETAALPLAAG